VSAAIPLQLWVSFYSVPGESDPYAKLKAIKCEPMSGELLFWKLTAQYDNKPFDTNTISNPTATSGGSLTNTPTQPSAPSPPGGQSPQVRPWGIKWGCRQTEEFVWEDRNGKKAVASNGQPFEGGLQVPKAQPYFTLTCYTALANYQKVGQYVNCCNDAMFLGFNTYNLRCSDYSITSQYEDQ
jgi:hypothetical protein